MRQPAPVWDAIARPAAMIAAVLAPVRTREQAWLAVTAGVALAVMWTWGRWFERRVLRSGAGGPALRPFTLVYLGELVLLALAAVVLPLNGLVAAAIGVSAPLTLIVLAATAAVAFAGPRVRVRGGLAPPDLLTLAGLGSIAAVVAVYSRHLATLGLDIHEHATWARQIVQAGHVVLTEPRTGVLADYPRTFHVLLALWDAAGVGGPIGPWAKIMPFLQTALPALSLAELVAEALCRESGARPVTVHVALGAAFGVYAFALTPMAYPVFDLVGTARLGSTCFLFAPVVLAVVGRVHGWPRARLVAVASLPLVAAWCATSNPVVPLILVAIGLPFLAAIWIAIARAAPGGRGSSFGTDRSAARGRRGFLLATLAFTAVGVLVIAQDPWMLWQAARRSRPIDAALGRAGVLSWERAWNRGIVPDRGERMSPRASSPAPPASFSTAARLGVRDALQLPRDLGATVAADLGKLVRTPAAAKEALRGVLLPAPATVSDWAALPMLALVAGGVFTAAIGAWRGRRSSFAASLLVGSLGGLVVADLGLRFTFRFATSFLGGGHDPELLCAYLVAPWSRSSVGFSWVPVLTSVAVIVDAARARNPNGPVRPRAVPRAAAAVGLAAWIALPLVAELNLDVPRRHSGFWSPVLLADIEALRRIERRVPPEEEVIVPAEHWSLNGEEWVIPVGDTTSLLPYGDDRYVFNVYLGPSYRYGWRDLEAFCDRDPAVHRAFLERSGIRWLLARARGATTPAEVASRTRICERPLAEIASAVPVDQQRDLVLFRLRTDRRP